MVCVVLSVASWAWLFLILWYDKSAEAVAQGALRFYRSGYATTNQAWSSGIVEIYYSGSWGNICYGYTFGQTEADVICHQMGYIGASSYDSSVSSIFGTDTQSTAIEDVSCRSSSYLSITQCSFSSLHSYSCNDDYEDIIVSCYIRRIWNSPTTGDIRLTGGEYSNQGLLEVYCNGEWGMVCGDTFDSTEATVACKQLGYNAYHNYNHLSHEDTTSPKMWLDGVSQSGCSYSANCLTSCQPCPLRTATCCHSQAVTLECKFDSSYGDVYTGIHDTCEHVSPDSVVYNNNDCSKIHTGDSNHDTSDSDENSDDNTSNSDENSDAEDDENTSDNETSNSDENTDADNNENTSDNDTSNSDENTDADNNENTSDNETSNSDENTDADNNENTSGDDASNSDENTDADNIENTSGLSTPSIIGIVIGSIAFIAICVLTITVPICARKYSRKRATQSDMVYREPQTMQNHYEPSFSISPPPSYFSLFSQTRSPRYESLQEEYPPSFN